MRFTFIRNHPQYGPWFERVESQPSWVVKAAVAATILVIAVPVVLLTLAAVVIGVAVFAVLGLVARAIVGLQRLTGAGNRAPGHAPRHDTQGRENVRVIDTP